MERLKGGIKKGARRAEEAANKFLVRIGYQPLDTDYSNSFVMRAAKKFKEVPELCYLLGREIKEFYNIARSMPVNLIESVVESSDCFRNMRQNYQKSQKQNSELQTALQEEEVRADELAITLTQTSEKIIHLEKQVTSLETKLKESRGNLTRQEFKFTESLWRNFVRAVEALDTPKVGGVFVKKESRNLYHINHATPKAEIYLGINKEDLIGKPISSFFDLRYIKPHIEQEYSDINLTGNKEARYGLSVLPFFIGRYHAGSLFLITRKTWYDKGAENLRKIKDNMKDFWEKFGEKYPHLREESAES